MATELKMRLHAVVCAGAVLTLLIPLRSATGQSASADVGFKTPSGRIHCEAFPDDEGRTAILRCDITGPNQPRVRRPADCELDYGYAFELRSAKGARASLICAGDTVADPKHRVLAYGGSWEYMGLRCEVTPARLRCLNASGHGFALSSRQQRLF